MGGSRVVSQLQEGLPDLSHPVQVSPAPHPQGTSIPVEESGVGLPVGPLPPLKRK